MPSDERRYIRHDKGSNRYIGGSDEHECDEHECDECHEDEDECCKDKDECWEIKAKICFSEHDAVKNGNGGKQPQEPGVSVKNEDKHDENCIKIEAEIRHGECREHKECDENDPPVRSRGCDDECEEHKERHDKDECWKIKAEICFPELCVMMGGLGGIIKNGGVSLKGEEENTGKGQNMQHKKCIKIEAEIKHKKCCEREHDD